jgi:hypothetical protein
MLPCTPGQVLDRALAAASPFSKSALVPRFVGPKPVGIPAGTKLEKPSFSKTQVFNPAAARAEAAWHAAAPSQGNDV